MTHGNGTRRRPLAAGLVTTIALAAMVVGGAPLASADPTPPSDQAVQDARAAVRDASQSVAEMEVRLAELSVSSDAAQLRVQQAGEAYTQALVDAQDAQDSADEAADAAKKAADDAEAARRTLVAIAREMARSGGSVDMIESLLSADGFQDVAQRTSALDRVSGKADEAVQEFRAATLVAGTLQDHAAASAATANQKSKDAAASLRSAEKTQQDADDAVAAAGVERDALIGNLADARSTSVAVERARQDQLDADRRQRADDEAREAHESSGDNSGTDDPPTGTDPGKTDDPPNPPAPDPDPEPTDEPTATTPPTTPKPSASPRPTANPQPTSAPKPTKKPTPRPTPTPKPTPKPTPAYGLGTGTSSGSAAQGRTALAEAKDKIGLPYIWGGTGPKGYDCSGLTMTSWQSAGVYLNRTSRDQYKQVLKINYDNLRVGDLVFWSTDPSNPNAIYHVAMWAGNGQIMEAPRPGVPLRVTSMRWSGTMPYAGRP